ncbi:hypothetical protein [Sphingobacterium bovistauri]|uniref:Uncharacterized protein n=1 Tax=Sphingobacterium bovistauri TaxID=2781959 RepID=A0ABS7Z3N9_9SPHI|nr:hypothetical protein [Sphingobacterium bovistauri]MCA5004791.1 hypothetical protein [Sphingobacterium bovistauri]
MNINNVIDDYLSLKGIFSALKYTIYIIFNAPYSKHRNTSIDLQGRIFKDFEIAIGESFKKIKIFLVSNKAKVSSIQKKSKSLSHQFQDWCDIYNGFVDMNDFLKSKEENR